MKFTKDKYFLANLCLIIAGLALAAAGIIHIFRSILEGHINDQNDLSYILVGMDVFLASFMGASTPRTGVVGDERTKRAAEKAGLCALLILVGCLILLGLINGLWESIKDESFLPFVLAHIGVYSWVVLAYYFIKKGDME